MGVIIAEVFIVPSQCWVLTLPPSPSGLYGSTCHIKPLQNPLKGVFRAGESFVAGWDTSTRRREAAPQHRRGGGVEVSDRHCHKYIFWDVGSSSTIHQHTTMSGRWAWEWGSTPFLPGICWVTTLNCYPNAAVVLPAPEFPAGHPHPSQEFVSFHASWIPWVGFSGQAL